MPLQQLADQPQFEYDLPNPNDGVCSMYDLRFGRSDYEKIRRKPTLPENAPYWDFSGKYAHLRRDWRTLLITPDPWACRFLIEDFTGRFLVDPTELHLCLQLWDPQLLEDMLVVHPKVVEAVCAAAKKSFMPHTIRPLVSFLPRFFRTEYRKAYHVQWLEEIERCPVWELSPDGQKQMCGPSAGRNTYKPHTFEELWQQATLQFDKGVELIAKFLCRHYCLYPMAWVPMMAVHGDMSEYWKHFTTKALVLPKKPMQVIQKIRPPFIPDPVPDQGVSSGNQQPDQPAPGKK